MTTASTKASSKHWEDLYRRSMTILIGVPVLCLVWSHSVLRHVFFQATHVAICLEWIRLTQCHAAFLVLSVALVNVQDSNLFFGAALVTAAAVSTTILAKKENNNNSNNPNGNNNNNNNSNNNDTSNLLISSSPEPLLTGFFLISIPFRAWCWSISTTYQATFSLLWTVWFSDSGALVAGRWSKQYLTLPPSPSWLRQISPKKSVMGLLGAFVVGSLCFVALPTVWSVLYQWNLVPAAADTTDGVCDYYDTWYTDGLLRGLILSLAAAVGDLWESSLKRRYGVKDTGKLLPGHGGVLDRFDSSLLVVLLYPHVVKC